MELGDIGATFLPVVEQLLAHTPWSEITLVEVRVLYCKQKKNVFKTIKDS